MIIKINEETIKSFVRDSIPSKHQDEMIEQLTSLCDGISMELEVPDEKIDVSVIEKEDVVDLLNWFFSLVVAWLAMLIKEGYPSMISEISTKMMIHLFPEMMARYLNKDVKYYDKDNIDEGYYFIGEEVKA